MQKRSIECGYPAMRHYLKLCEESEVKAFAHFYDCYGRMDRAIRTKIDGLEFGTYQGLEDFTAKRPGDYLELYCCLHFLQFREEFPATEEDSKELWEERRKALHAKMAEVTKATAIGLSCPGIPSSGPAPIETGVSANADRKKIKPAKRRKW